MYVYIRYVFLYRCMYVKSNIISKWHLTFKITFINASPYLDKEDPGCYLA